MTEAPKREGQRWEEEGKKTQGGEGKRKAECSRGRWEGGKASRRARRASGQGGSVELKKEKLKIRTVILSGGTIRCDVPFDFRLNQSDLLQLVLKGRILFLVSSKLIFVVFLLQFWNLMHF